LRYIELLKNMWGKAVDEIKKVRWKAYHGTTRHLIEENVLIEIATVTYSKSLWWV
jgi:hypothetical protein